MDWWNRGGISRFLTTFLNWHITSWLFLSPNYWIPLHHPLAQPWILRLNKLFLPKFKWASACINQVVLVQKRTLSKGGFSKILRIPLDTTEFGGKHCKGINKQYWEKWIFVTTCSYILGQEDCKSCFPRKSAKFRKQFGYTRPWYRISEERRNLNFSTSIS